MSHPQTDIICLVHNALEVTKGFVKHLYNNTENFRLILVDNGSGPVTQKYLEECANIGAVVIRSDINLGVIKGRNLGAKSVIADYFLNIDNDQYVQKNWLEYLFQLMNQGHDIVGKEAWCLVPPSQGGNVIIKGIQYNRTYYPHKKCTKKTDKFTYIGCGGMLIKKTIYDEIGLFDEQFSPAYFEDPDFCFRAIQSGFSLGWQNDCSIEHLAHQTINSQSLFQKNKQFLKSWKLFQEKWYPYFPGETK